VRMQVSRLKKQVLPDGAAAICARELARETGDFGAEKVPRAREPTIRRSKSSDGERATSPNSASDKSDFEATLLYGASWRDCWKR
jgi:hypothetical protein